MIYLDLLIGFLKVGLFSFGGAYAAIPLIRDVVLAHEWLDDEMLSYMIAVSESTPTPIHTICRTRRLRGYYYRGDNHPDG